MERLYEARKGEVEKRLRARELADAEVTDTIDEKIRTIDERIKEYGDDATTATVCTSSFCVHVLLSVKKDITRDI